MASGIWGRSSAWEAAPTQPGLIPSFEDVMKEQERETTQDNKNRVSSKRASTDWIDSQPWYPGKVNRNKKRIQSHQGIDTEKPARLGQKDSVAKPDVYMKHSGITVANVHRKDLMNSGYNDLVEWLKVPNHIYIGRDMTRFVPGAKGSMWHNPFKSKEIGRENSVKQFKEYILSDKTRQANGKTLFESLGELKGKTLGCWCHPEKCHGHILRELVEQYCQ